MGNRPHLLRTETAGTTRPGMGHSRGTRIRAGGKNEAGISQTGTGSQHSETSHRHDDPRSSSGREHPGLSSLPIQETADRQDDPTVTAAKPAVSRGNGTPPFSELWSGTSDFVDKTRTTQRTLLKPTPTHHYRTTIAPVAERPMTDEFSSFPDRSLRAYPPVRSRRHPRSAQIDNAPS